MRHPAPQAVGRPAAGERSARGATREEAGHERAERGAARSGRGDRRRTQGRRPRGRCRRAPPPAEKAAAKDTYLSEFVAERGKRDRQSQAWELLLTRSYDEPPTWRQIFDDLAPEVHAELGELYDALPGRRPGGVRAPVRGPVRRLTAGRRPPMTRPVTTPGRLVAGRYRLQSQIGGGGMGAVWLARDELLGRQVAVKQVLVPGRTQRRGGRPAAAAGPARGPDRRPAEPPARDLGLRRRPGGRPAVAGHGVPALAQPRRGAHRGRRAAGGPGGPDRRPGGRRAGRHARGRDRAPRREAGQHPDRRGRPASRAWSRSPTSASRTPAATSR